MYKPSWDLGVAMNSGRMSLWGTAWGYEVVPLPGLEPGHTV